MTSDKEYNELHLAVTSGEEIVPSLLFKIRKKYSNKSLLFHIALKEGHLPVLSLFWIMVLILMKKLRVKLY